MENDRSKIWLILDKRKERAQLALVQMTQILDLNTQFKKFQMRNDPATTKTDNIKSSDKNSLKINLTSLESNSMPDDIFGITTSVEKNYHIASNEIDIIFDAN